MKLVAFARLVDAEPKWVLNTLVALALPRAYSTALARELAVARAIHLATHGTLVQCFTQAREALRDFKSGAALVNVRTDVAEVGLLVDVARILSSFDARLSRLETSESPRQRGRPARRRRDPLRAAAEWGTDLTLLVDNMSKTPEQRVRQLDAMLSFSRRVRRPASPR